MAQNNGYHEIKFIAAFILIASFFGLSEQTASFFFPAIGQQVFKTINFYYLIIIGFLGAILWQKSIGKGFKYFTEFPSLFDTTVRYLISLPIFYILFMIFFGNISAIPVPRTDLLITETIISFSENLLLLYLIPAVWAIGDYDNSLNGINSFLNNLRFYLPAIIIITALHAGNYALMANSFEDFYFSIIAAFVMFCVFVAIKELFGFGASEGAHASFNTALLSIRGSII